MEGGGYREALACITVRQAGSEAVGGVAAPWLGSLASRWKAWGAEVAELPGGDGGLALVGWISEGRVRARWDQNRRAPVLLHSRDGHAPFSPPWGACAAGFALDAGEGIGGSRQGGGVRNSRGETPRERPGARRASHGGATGSAEPQLGEGRVARQAGAWRSVR